MTTREDAIRACLTLPFSYEDYPFDDTNWTIIRHLENKKIFAMIFQREGRIWINVKAEPVSGDFWRQIYPAVVPAYHMNKQHWISIILDGSMEEDDILRLIQDSYALTAPKKKGRGPASQDNVQA
ncbi:MAG: MmcQ/YjbR family DNA-binding protein [Clostridiales bacterium]|nr:MmcQ/YjbR family DNA-binding protein [Clostridiales bacterium]